VTPAFAGTLVLLGFAGAFVSGLVGVGGAIVMIPLLYYAPPLLGVGSLPMPEVSGVTMVQVLVAAAVGAWIHGRHAAVQRELAVTGARPWRRHRWRARLLPASSRRAPSSSCSR